MPKANDVFPTHRWDSKTGLMSVANSAADVKPDSLPCHPNDPDRAEKVKADPVAAVTSTAASPTSSATKPAASPVAPHKSMSRADVLKALEEGGVDIPQDASHADLYATLVASVKAALAQAKIPFDATSTDAKALLALIPAE